MIEIFLEMPMELKVIILSLINLCCAYRDLMSKFFTSNLLERVIVSLLQI